MTTSCPTCGSPVRVVTGDEGTSHYEPLDERVAILQGQLNLVDNLLRELGLGGQERWAALGELRSRVRAEQERGAR